MSKPIERWLAKESSAPSDVVDILRSARKGPDGAAKARIWRELSVGSAAAASTATRAIPAAKQPLIHTAAGKLTIAVIALGGLVAIARFASSPRSSPSAAPTREVPSTPATPVSQPRIAPRIESPVSSPASAPHAIVTTTVAAPPAPSAAPTPVRVAAHSVAPRASSPSRPAPSHTFESESAGSIGGGGNGATDELDAEILLVANARASLATNPARALELVDAPTVATQRSTLAHEREAIAIDALSRLHRWNDAIARADRFLAAHPSSTSAPRIRSLREAATAARTRPTSE